MSESDGPFTESRGYASSRGQSGTPAAPPPTPASEVPAHSTAPDLDSGRSLSIGPNGSCSERSRARVSRSFQQVCQLLEGVAADRASLRRSRGSRQSCLKVSSAEPLEIRSGNDGLRAVSSQLGGQLEEFVPGTLTPVPDKLDVAYLSGPHRAYSMPAVELGDLGEIRTLGQHIEAVDPGQPTTGHKTCLKGGSSQVRPQKSARSTRVRFADPPLKDESASGLSARAADSKRSLKHGTKASRWSFSHRKESDLDFEPTKNRQRERASSHTRPCFFTGERCRQTHIHMVNPPRLCKTLKRINTDTLQGLSLRAGVPAFSNTQPSCIEKANATLQRPSLPDATSDVRDELKRPRHENFDGPSDTRSDIKPSFSSYPTSSVPRRIFAPENCHLPGQHGPEHSEGAYAMATFPSDGSRGDPTFHPSPGIDPLNIKATERAGWTSHQNYLSGRESNASQARAPKDWSPMRKRCTAMVVCSNTALVGLAVGVYAGEVPALQYQIADLKHYTVLGNVVFYAGLAIPSLLCWTLPFVYGRKLFSLMALGLFLPLQLPQAAIVISPRSPDIAAYRTGLLVCRALSGLALGFLNINLFGSLLELFGASLHNPFPHQEMVKDEDSRRHGGGMGLWLGIWTWSFVGSIGFGFLLGALIIDGLNPVWGFSIITILGTIVFLLNLVVPDTRPLEQDQSLVSKHPQREHQAGTLTQICTTGLERWRHEMWAGVTLKWRMFQQIGFTSLALYLTWIYGHTVMAIILLGRLMSTNYLFLSPYVGLCVAAVPIGAMLSIPLQKRSSFRRGGIRAKLSQDFHIPGSVTWSSHLIRRTSSMLLFPFAGLGFAVTTGGPSMHYMVPTVFAALMGFLSTLAAAECIGLIMETFDTSDLRSSVIEGTGLAASSSYPRISAAFAIIQAMSFIFAAVTTGFGGPVARKVGTQTATGIVDGVTFALTILAVCVLLRGKRVQVDSAEDPYIVPHEVSDHSQSPVPRAGHQSEKTRRMNLLEMGNHSRWTDIRRRNGLMR